MSFLETVARARAFLEHSGRISLSGLRREFDLDEDALEALVEELVDTQQVAAREGKILAWLGRSTAERELASESIHPAGAAAPETLRPYPTERERRHLTVMFCDLVGSTALSQQLDAEVYSEVLQAYHSCAEESIARFDGHVGQYLGDGLLVYFGYPQAHEDDAERAIRAARDLLRELGELNPQLEAEQGVQIQARIAIHTGPVVIDEIGRGAKHEMLALGDTLNIAARLEAFAEPDTVVISDATLELVAGLFVTEDRGMPSLKGVSDPIHAHRVLQPSGVTSRLDRTPTLTPFVGREHELGLLLDGFEHAREGQGQTLVIAGEAGIGKSRLTRRLRELLRETPHTWLECHSTPYTMSSALHPLIEMLQRVLRFGEEDGTTHIDRLEQWLEHESMDRAQAVPLFASLLSLQLPDRYQVSEISPQAQRQQTLDALLTWLLGLAEKQPVVILTEDLHWSDPSTLEWLNLLIERCPTARLLVLLTHRPEFEPSWPSRAHIRSIVLGRLTTRQAKDLIAAATPRTTLPDDVVAPLAARSDGVPLFAEELVKSVIESAPRESGSFSVSEIPETLQDLLMARLDRLGNAKRVAQLGAAFGREFEYALLERTMASSDTPLRLELDRLARAELVYQRGVWPKATYTFKHALVQDMAYQSLLQSERRAIHGRIADVLEKYCPERCARDPESIARHCEEAGRTVQAIGHYQRAAEQATQRSAHIEAIDHLQRALALLETLPKSAERDREEIRLRIRLGVHLQATRGMTSPEVEATYQSALSLARGLSDSPDRFQALSGLAIFYRNREVRRALELGEELLTHSERTGVVSQLLFAHSTIGVALHYSGEVEKALEHQEQAIALYDSIEHQSLEFVYGLDPGVTSECLSSFGLLQLGYPDRALEQVERAIEQARTHDHAYSLAYALNWGAVVHHERGEPQRVLERATEAFEISTERGLSQQLGGAALYRACALSHLSDEEAAGHAVDSVAKNIRGAGPRSPVSGPFLAALADAQRRLRRLDDALGTVDSWLSYAAEIGAPYWDAEHMRLKGVILLASDPASHDDAERLFRRAISIAKSQHSRSLEIRAANSLAQLLNSVGRREESRDLLQPLYQNFTEGFRTRDLRETDALLQGFE